MSLQSSCIGPHEVHKLDDWWCLHWLEHQGEGADELHEMTVIVNARRRGEERGCLEAWYPDSRTANVSLPSTPIAPDTHVSSTTTMSTMSSRGVHMPALQVHPSYTCQPTHSQFEYPKRCDDPQRWCSPCNQQSNSPAQSSTPA